MALWDEYRLALVAFAAGLVLGPLLTAALGWQLSAGAVEEKVHDAVVAEQAAACAYRVRQANENVNELGYNARRDLAQDFADVPWGSNEEMDYEVVGACARQLAESARASGNGTG